MGSVWSVWLGAELSSKMLHLTLLPTAPSHLFSARRAAARRPAAAAASDASVPPRMLQSHRFLEDGNLRSLRGFFGAGSAAADQSSQAFAERSPNAKREGVERYGMTN